MEISLNPVAAGMPPYPMSEIAEIAKRVREEGRAVYDFTIGDPLDPTPDFIRRALLDGVPEVSQYPTVRGRPELRKAAAGWVHRRFGVSLDPDTEILPTNGSKEAIFHLAMLVIDPGSPRRGVVYGEPGYPVYERGAALAGGIPLPVPLTSENDFVLDPTELSPEAAERTAVLWLNYPHNPTGATATLDDHRRILDWSRDRSVLVCSDECYVDTYYGDGKPSSLLEAAGDQRGGALAFFSCSKRSGMTGYRTGFVAGDARLLRAYAELRTSLGTATPDFVQHAAIFAWSDDRHAAQRRSVFSAKRAIFDRLFGEIGVDVVASKAAFYMWLRAPGGMTGDAYSKRLIEAGILVTPGASFGPSGEGFVRMALVPTVNECEQAADAWRRLASC